MYYMTEYQIKTLCKSRSHTSHCSKKNCADSRPLQSLGASIGEAPDLLGTLHTWGALSVGDVDPTAPAAAPPVRSAIPALGCAMYLGDGSSTRNCKKMKPFSSKVSVY